MGTRQDADSRFSRIFRDGRKLLVEAIEYLKTIAPVDVLVVVGNHDSNSMFHLPTRGCAGGNGAAAVSAAKIPRPARARSERMD